MSRFRDLQDDADESAIDISPLIDCVFILLIFFIVTTVFVEETGVEVDKPQASAATQLEKNSILLAVTREGAVVYDGRDIKVSGVQAEVRRLLQKDKNLPVIIQADQNASAGLLVQVVGEAKLADATKVSVSAEPLKR